MRYERENIDHKEKKRLAFPRIGIKSTVDKGESCLHLKGIKGTNPIGLERFF